MANVENKEITQEYASTIRASYYFMSALLGKYKKVEMYFPGGCSIGARPIDIHIKSFKELLNYYRYRKNEIFTKGNFFAVWQKSYRKGMDKRATYQLLSGAWKGKKLHRSRSIYANGRNMCKINGRLVTVTELKNFMSNYIEIHGQNDNQQLLDCRTHIRYLDSFIGKDILEIKSQYRILFEI